ncbi:hypothetical protein BGW80DRAFT_1319022 [Lactifluus volemus]|nr:hypothetical protein BGW80DRAFT_1319022 [Lactifluus volemus]
MSNSFLLPVEYYREGRTSRRGVILLDDSLNMCHPLTSGIMTVALLDVVLIAPMIVAEPDLANWHAIKNMPHRWVGGIGRKNLSRNILGVALYDREWETYKHRNGC